MVELEGNDMTVNNEYHYVTGKCHNYYVSELQYLLKQEINICHDLNTCFEHFEPGINQCFNIVSKIKYNILW